jgi:hypothetical protein
VQGRAFDGGDSATGARTAIVNESLARTYWPNETALGRRIDVWVGDLDTGDRDREQRTVVGVVDDVQYDPLGMTRLGNSAIYVPLPQFTTASTRVVVRHFGDEDQARSAMYEALRRVDPTLAPTDGVRSYAAGLEQTTRFARTTMKLFAGCGAFAILLAITGIYGMSSNAVLRRSHEIGLRRALGASNRNIVAIFMAQGGRQLGVGLGLSALLCAAVLLVIRQGFAVSVWTLVLIGAAVVVVIAASVLLSIYLSVRGVIRLEPSAALRQG